MSQQVPTQHSSFVHDLAFDFYGSRLATCAGDNEIKIREERNDGWKEIGHCLGHTAPILKVSWAHPEYGQVLASCSSDRQVIIWEEPDPEGEGHEKRVAWTEKARLGDSRKAVKTIEFAPHHLGLKLATGSEDGFVRIYEAPDITNLAIWPMQEEFEVDTRGVNCLSWCESRFDPPMIAVGGESLHAVQIYVYNQAFRRWQVHLSLEHSEVAKAVYDVAWAPSLGRSYHMIAAGGQDRNVRVWTVRPEEEGKQEAGGDSRKTKPFKLSVIKSEKLGEHEGDIWSVRWNVTGTVLATSGDDGRVKLWKQMITDKRGSQWKAIREYKQEIRPVDEAEFGGGGAGQGAGSER